MRVEPNGQIAWENIKVPGSKRVHQTATRSRSTVSPPLGLGRGETNKNGYFL